MQKTILVKDTRIAIIGCGNLGRAILNGLLHNGLYNPSKITVTRRNTDALKDLEGTGVNITSDNRKAVAESDILFISLKPYNQLKSIEAFGSDLDPKRHVLVSLATGIHLSSIQEITPGALPLFRAMPNTGSEVQESLTCLSSLNASPQQIALVKSSFDSIGETVLIDEELMDAATVLGACGIAYVLRFMRAMIQGGIQIGFDSATAKKIVSQTMKGAAELIIQGGRHPEFEIDKVTTPKGCTIAGLNEMEHNGFSSALIKGIVTSYNEIK